MIKKRLTIRGPKVHNVTYRFFLYNEASKLGIPSFDARNIKEEQEVVEVLVEGEEEKVERFTTFAKSIFPPLAEVSEVVEEDYEGTVRAIESFEQSFALEQQSKTAFYGLNMLNTLGRVDKTTQSMNETTQNMDKKLEGIDKTLGRVDETTGSMNKTLEGMNKTLEGIDEKQDTLRESVERGFEELREEHIKTRETSREIFYSEVQELRQELKDLRIIVEEIRKKVGIV